MTFKELLAKAEKAKTVKKVSIEVKKFDAEGQTITGRLISVDVVESAKFDGDYNRYLFDTDEGKVAVSLGSSMDMLHKAGDMVGRIYHITYKGKRKLDSGRTMNEYDVIEIPE